MRTFVNTIVLLDSKQSLLCDDNRIWKVKQAIYNTVCYGISFLNYRFTTLFIIMETK